MFSKRS